MHANVPLFTEMIEKRNEASREAAIEALDMKEKELSAKRIREFDPELLQVPWVTVHIADQSINLLWHLFVFKALVDGTYCSYGCIYVLAKRLVPNNYI